MKVPAISCGHHRADFVPEYLLNDEEAQRFLRMAIDYHNRCHIEPFLNRCVLALMVCAKGYELPIPLVQSHAGQTKIGEDRQKMMAFSRVISLKAPCPNSWKGIARVFHRAHPTVIHATHKYGGRIAAILGGSYDQSR